MHDPALTETQEILVQLCFWAPLAFLIVYTCVCPWWQTMFGRVVAALAFVFVAVLLRAELFLWHVLPISEENHADWLSWFSVACLGLAPVAFATLTWHLVRKPVRQWWHWLRNGKAANPIAPKEESEPLNEFVRLLRAQQHDEQVKKNSAKIEELTEELRKMRLGKDVSPPADVDTIDGSA